MLVNGSFSPWSRGTVPGWCAGSPNKTSVEAATVYDPHAPFTLDYVTSKPNKNKRIEIDHWVHRSKSVFSVKLQMPVIVEVLALIGSAKGLGRPRSPEWLTRKPTTQHDAPRCPHASHSLHPVNRRSGHYPTGLTTKTLWSIYSNVYIYIYTYVFISIYVYINVCLYRYTKSTLSTLDNRRLWMSSGALHKSRDMWKRWKQPQNTQSKSEGRSCICHQVRTISLYPLTRGWCGGQLPGAALGFLVTLFHLVSSITCC